MNGTAQVVPNKSKRGRTDMQTKTNSDAVVLNRRRLLTGTGMAIGALAAAPLACAQTPAMTADPLGLDADEAPLDLPPEPTPLPGAPDWRKIRAEWALDAGWVDMSAMLLASNPRIVREAIDAHRRGLDNQPVIYLEGRNRQLQDRVRRMAGAYFNVPYGNVALTESTTDGIGQLYAGITLRPGEEALTTNEDYYVTHESLRLQACKGRCSVRKIDLFEGPRSKAPGAVVQKIVSNIRPSTRVLALTWVHSSTGYKMPIREIAAALRPINAARPAAERVLFCVDGVHGFGIEDTTLPELGCDFLVAGTHKWIFGPRGTGVVYGTDYGWSRVTPTVPSFLASNAYGAWIGGYDPGPTTGARMTPGGFKAFEHVWALAEAFQFQQQVGKAHVQARTRELAGRLKAGLAQMPHVSLRTPIDPDQSAGIVSFDVAGFSAREAVQRLRKSRIIGSAAPYAVQHVRLTPSIRNTPEEIDRALAAVRAMRA
ncbi:MAG: aminotransferase class V-fold PLP-dependent enzyme [Caulobacter sp.]|nr:aminotransferase class V-fold PLP-dependent enzyme [Caulobacter sp.]